jgi:1-acyl-sn-glycerol-3-phosphate acyltransferase
VVRRRTERPGPYLRLCVLVLYPLISLLWRRRWSGAERIPRHGPAILALNHVSHADPLAVGRLVWDIGRSPRFLAKATLFDLPVVGAIMTGSGQIPVHRGSADAQQALQGAISALRSGKLVIIYPEGTVTRDPAGWPMQAKTGIARLVLDLPDVPVIPIGQWGAQDFLDVYHRRFRPWPRKRVTMSVGLPVDLTRFRGRPASSDNLAAITDAIMHAVATELGSIRHLTPPEQFFPAPRAAAPPVDDSPRSGRR